VVRGAFKAIDFYKKAFHAEEVARMTGPDGQSIMHAELKIGDSRIMLVDEMPQMQRWVSPARLNGTTIALCIFVEDCDKLFAQAIAAGASESMKPMDAFWGDRYSKVTDPFGHEWEICTHKEDVSPEECNRRAAEWMKNFSKQTAG